MERDYIENIGLNINYSYYYNNYLDKSEICVIGINENGIEGNVWTTRRHTYKAKLKIITFRGQVVYVPIIVLLPKIDDYELIEHLAILDFEKPQIEINYYKIGDFYGLSRKTEVKNANTLVKNIQCIAEDNVNAEIYEYSSLIKSKLTSEEISKRVQNYLAEVEEAQMWEQESSKEDITYSLGGAYYNDQLDLDQQEPDFWDSL